MSLDLASASRSYHFENREDGLGQQGSKIDLGQYDRRMTGLTPYEIITSAKIDVRVKDKLRSLVLCRPRIERPSERGIVPLLGQKAIQQLPSALGRINLFSCLVIGRLDFTRVPVDCQALILAPSGELAKEIKDVICLFGGQTGVKVQAIPGEEEASLRRENHVVVGTPGKVLDLLRSKSLSPRNIRMFVLDYADQMLSLGLEDKIYNIFQMLPSDLQVGVFTKSTPPELYEFTRKLMNQPV